MLLQGALIGVIAETVWYAIIQWELHGHLSCIILIAKGLTEWHCYIYTNPKCYIYATKYVVSDVEIQSESQIRKGAAPSLWSSRVTSHPSLTSKVLCLLGYSASSHQLPLPPYTTHTDRHWMLQWITQRFQNKYLPNIQYACCFSPVN